jgi:hypothetical protein
MGYEIYQGCFMGSWGIRNAEDTMITVPINK